MQREPDGGFLQKLRDFNDSQGGPMEVAVCWDDIKHRWVVWVIPHGPVTHPLHSPKKVRQHLKTMPDGRKGVKLFTWQDGEGEYLPLDDRLLHSLKLADSFSSRQHFEEAVENPETLKNMQERDGLRDVLQGTMDYYYGWDRAVIGPGSRGDWRWRHR